MHVRNSMCYLCVAFKVRPVRLGVRTQDFHSCNTGSIPVRATQTPHNQLVMGGVFFGGTNTGQIPFNLNILPLS